MTNSAAGIAQHMASVLCRTCGGGIAHDPQQRTYRFYCGPECAATALARRYGYSRRIDAVNPQPTEAVMAAKKKNTKATTTKATKTAKVKAPAAPTAYTAAKLKVQAQCPIGATRTYSGRKSFDGKKVKIVEHEQRGGVVIEVGGKKYVVSPFAVGATRPDAKKPAPPTATTSKGKAAPAPAKKSAPSAPAAPEAPAPVEPAKAPAKARLRRVA